MQAELNATAAWREGLLRWMLASAFLLFFQAYMVAPLIPFLATKLEVSRSTAGLVVPAYLLPYAFGTFVHGICSDRWGRRGVMAVCLATFATCCALTAAAHSMNDLLIWRAMTGLAGSGVAVVALTLIGDLFPFEERGRALGWLFGAVAGGGAFGSTLGGLLTPIIGWPGLFLAVGLLTFVPFFGILSYWNRLAPDPDSLNRHSPLEILQGYAQLLGNARGVRTYSYVLLNGVFHSGTFTWLGAYLVDRYGLGEAAIGLALLGYGIPGFFGGPLIGKATDKRGRGKILPWGMLVAALSGLVLILPLPLVLAMAAITALSLGFDMSHPLLAGIVTTLAPERRGQAMGLNGFTLFFGFGFGSLAFGWAMQHWGFNAAMGVFGVGQLVLAVAGMGLFRGETAGEG